MLHAQARNSNWIIGSGVWLQITPDNAFSLPMEDTVSTRNASISDISGQFLLLADDQGIRNAIFNTIQGGSAAELGWQVPAGNYLILPVPGHSEQYAVFINELPPSKRAGMVLVDLTVNAGAGAVVGETTWYMDQATAKITATTDSAETGYWIVQHQDNNDAFLAFHLISSGLQMAPVVSYVGTSYLPDAGPVDNMDRQGQMNFNFQGDRLGVVKFSNTSADTCKVELFSFNRNSGTLAYWSEINARDFTLGVVNAATPVKLKELDFDTTGQFLLVGIADNGTSAMGEVQCVQFDLATPNPETNHFEAGMVIGMANYLFSDFDCRYGHAFSTGPYGQLLFHHWYTPVPTIQMQHLYMEVPPLQNFGQTIFWEGKIMGGLPAPCKRYDTLGPQTIGIGNLPLREMLGLYPNPMANWAVLVYHGTSVPEILVWRDALGREQRISIVEKSGGAFRMERGDLPDGMYFVEVRGKHGTLGVVKVVCD